MLLTGSFSRAMDEKLRVAIPKRLRAAMQLPEGGALYVAPGTDQSLAVYTEEAFQRLARRLADAPPTRQDVRAFVRLFYARAECVELDGQGRIRIPRDLAELAGLGPESNEQNGRKQTVLLAVHDHLELWAADRWEAYLREKQDQYDVIAETTFGGSNPSD